jgi:putative tryptophan/tyrosine transport system substrate-binding protein
MKKAAGPSILCAVILLAVVVIAEAQQPGKIPRIGFLSAQSESRSAERAEAFRQGLRDLGYVTGKNIIIDYRWGDGNSNRLATLADELVGLKVDLIVTSGKIKPSTPLRMQPPPFL